jgi:hypothetical protein
MRVLQDWRGYANRLLMGPFQVRVRLEREVLREGGEKREKLREMERRKKNGGSRRGREKEMRVADKVRRASGLICVRPLAS